MPTATQAAHTYLPQRIRLQPGREKFKSISTVNTKLDSVENVSSKNARRGAGALYSTPLAKVALAVIAGIIVAAGVAIPVALTVGRNTATTLSTSGTQISSGTTVSTTTITSTTITTATTTTLSTTTATTTSTTTSRTSTTSTSTSSTTSVTTSTTTSTSSTTTTSIPPVCTSFWKMPASDVGTYFTYSNNNTLISGDLSRSGCATFIASASNGDNIIFEVGSSLTTTNGGCNQHWALAVEDASHITIYGMCGAYDNANIYVGGSTLFDGNFHQVCVTYDRTVSQLCVYLDLLASSCITRSNGVYNTGLGDVRVGWWPDLNRGFTGSGGGLIKLVTLFNVPINASCVTYQYQLNNIG